MPRPSSKSHIIDCAESLFAEEGIDKVSLRQINEASGLSPAALHYHFKNKESLITEVLQRRLRPKAVREAELDLLIGKELEVTPRAIASALVNPLATIFIEDGAGGESYVQILSQIYSDRSQRFHPYLPKAFPTSINKFYKLLAELVDSDNKEAEAELKRRYQIAVVSMIQSLASFSAPLKASDNSATQLKQQYTKSLIGFIANGLTID